jgi:hypothetical protein
MLGFKAARGALEKGRCAFFGSLNCDLPIGRSETLRKDDQIPQFRYVGLDYASKRVLLLGINPGNGNRNDARTHEDVRMMPALRHFAENPTEENYVNAMQAYKNECQNFRVWHSHCKKVIESAGVTYEQIAYKNCLPWRTQSQSKFGKDVAMKTAELYLRPLIRELSLD